MKNSQEKKKSKKWQLFTIITGVIIGFAFGILLAKYFPPASESKIPLLQLIGYLLLLIFGMYFALMLQLIAHEAGHLIFGLISGYTFGSFRIFSFIWIKEEGKIKVRRLSLAGTGGQCLMNPPEVEGGEKGNFENFPAILYNLGGVIMNLSLSLIFGLVYLFAQHIVWLSIGSVILSVMGALLAVMNGIPMQTPLIPNDGYNAHSLAKSVEARRAFYLQLKIQQQINGNIRLKDMPEEWFQMPSDEGMSNVISSAIAVFRCNRLMDMHAFKDAFRLMGYILESDSNIAGIYRKSLVCDYIYCELLRCNIGGATALLMPEKKFMKAMKTNISALRTQYVYALFDKDGKNSENFKSQFEKFANVYPYKGEVAAECELMQIAEERYREYSDREKREE